MSGEVRKEIGGDWQNESERLLSVINAVAVDSRGESGLVARSAHGREGEVIKVELLCRLVLQTLGFNWSGVDPPLSSSRACLTAFIANSVP